MIVLTQATSQLNRLIDFFRAGVMHRLREAALIEFDGGIDADLVRGGQLKEILPLTPWMMTANIANAAIMFFYMLGTNEGSGTAVWAICVMLFSGITLHGWAGRRHLPPRDTASKRAIVSATRHAAILGAMWGVLPLVALPDASPTTHVLTITVIAGMSAGGAFALAAIPAAAAIYVTLILIPTLYSFGLGFIHASAPLFAMGTIYLVTLATIIVSRHKDFKIRIADQHSLKRQGDMISLLLKDFEASASDWLWETDGNGKLKYVSDRFATVTAKPRHQLLNQTLANAADAPTGDMQWQALSDKLAAGEGIREFVVPAKHGSYDAWWSITARPIIADNGARLGYRGVGTDITERKNAELALASQNAELSEFNRRLEEEVAAGTEEARRLAEHAIEASHAKSTFLASMSHEIRTPMNGVLGMTDLLKRTPLTQRQVRLVETIHHSGQTLLSIINDILDHSRIDAGKLELDAHEFNLRDCVEGAVEILSEEAHKKSLEISVLLPSSIPMTLIGDGGRLRQVLVNLIANAVKFTHSGTVAVRLGVRPPDDGRCVLTFEVADTGIGISKSAQKSLFNPFSQADSSISRRFGGTGLGLSIAQSIIRMMDGDITIDSTVGKGTTVSFHVTLPVGQTVSAEKLLPSHLEGKRMLVVDDRDTNREVIECYLTEFGAKVDCVSSGADALKKLRQRHADGTPYSVAIIDMLMPEMNGLDLARFMAAEKLTADTALILATSLSWRGDKQTARDCGYSEVLSKPIRYHDLFEAVRNCFPAANGAPAPTAEPITRDVDVVGGSLKLHVMLAEDNLVNQDVMSEYLALLGCTVVLAENGLEAVEITKTQNFDLILMDCQMPELDGISATRLIRNRERTLSTARTPVIAVTANAYESDKLACLAAEMDDVLTKPCNLEQLSRALIKWAPVARVQKHVDPTSVSASMIETFAATAPVQTIEPLDLEILAALEATKPGMAARLIDLFRSTAPKSIHQILVGITDEHHDKVSAAAHSLKSASAIIGANAIAECARRLEHMARSRDPMAKMLPEAAGLEKAFADLDTAFDETNWSKLARNNAERLAG